MNPLQEVIKISEDGWDQKRSEFFEACFQLLKIQNKAQGRMVGQVITPFICKFCGESCSNSDSGVPFFCMHCKKLLKIIKKNKEIEDNNSENT